MDASPLRLRELTSLSSGDRRRFNSSTRPDATHSGLHPTMSLLARSSSLRAVARLARPLATNAPAGSPYFAQLNALREHAARMHSAVSTFHLLSSPQTPLIYGAK